MTMTSKQGVAKGQGAAVGRAGHRRPVLGGKLVLLIGICALPFALLALPTTVLFTVGMAPTIVAFIVDRDPNKFAPITVGSLNFCGVMSSALPLWGGAHSLNGVATVLADPFTWLVMYAAAALGWLLYFSVPPAVSTFMAMRYQAEVDEMSARQAELKEEWGDEVADSDSQADAQAATG